MQKKDYPKLRSCPFCGGEALLRERYIPGVANRKHYRRECRHCKATFVDWYRSIKKADEAWNRRAQLANEPLTNTGGSFNNAPTIDTMPVVRCKECKHWYEYSCNEEYGSCHFWQANDNENTETESDGFCSYGQRKENT